MYSRCLLCVSAFLLSSCGLFQKPAYEEQGWASYIADEYNGRRTTSGEIYRPNTYTAAHTTLPFGTVVEVKNLQTGRSVRVTVNDRFPSYPGRVINVSAAAAREIGMPYNRLVQVRVTAQRIASGPYGSPSYGHSQSSHRSSTGAAAYHPPKKQAPRRYGAPAYGAPAYGAPAYGAPAYQPGATSYGAPAYGGGAPAYGAPAYPTAPAYPAYPAPASPYPPAVPSYPAAPPSYPSTPPAAPQYQYQPQPAPRGNYLPGFNNGAPPAGTGLR